MDKNTHIFLTRANQHIQEINRQFDENLNNFVPMLFAANQEKNESCNFKIMFLQPDKSYFILDMIK